MTEENYMTAPGEWQRTTEPLHYPPVDLSQPHERLELVVEDVGVVCYVLHQPGRLTMHRGDDTTITDEAQGQYWRSGFLSGLQTSIEEGETADEVWDAHRRCWAAGDLEQIQPDDR